MPRIIKNTQIVDDHWQVLLDFGRGCTASLAVNNVVVETRCPPLELHGLAGTIAFDPTGRPVSR